MFTGPNAGAPDPSITVASRISSDPNGPACSGALALCALAFVAAIAAPTPNNTATTVFIVLLDPPGHFPANKPARLTSWPGEVQHRFTLLGSLQSCLELVETAHLPVIAILLGAIGTGLQAQRVSIESQVVTAKTQQNTAFVVLWTTFSEAKLLRCKQ